MGESEQCLNNDKCPDNLLCDGNLKICRKNARVREYSSSFCSSSGRLCQENEGDCDNDDECEGSLECGSNNCISANWDSGADCCTKPCKNDSDCTTSGECDTEHSQCRLNSDIIHWSKCSQDSPCADGEGDCDDHYDCEGALLCGNDRCLSGPTSMDCCIGKFMNSRTYRNFG